MAKEKIGDKEIYYDGYLLSNLKIMRKKLRDDFDVIGVIDGPEGSGKSVLAQQLAAYVDPNFSIKNIVFTPDDFKNAILNAPKFSCIIFDEGYTGLASRQAMSATNKMLVNLLVQIRQRNLFVILCLPSIFDLDKYAAIWRSRFLIHVELKSEETKVWQRGYFSFYNAQKKKNLYILGKRMYDYNTVRPGFKGRFTKQYAVPQEEYKKKKLESLQKDDEPKANVRALEWKKQRDLLVIAMFKLGLKQRDIGRAMDSTQQQVSRILKEYAHLIEDKPIPLPLKPIR